MSMLSPIYASSVSELITPLNISKHVCSSNATKCNVCNASSISQLIRPLNVSKPVCPSKTTKCNICHASNVGQLITMSVTPAVLVNSLPLNFSKTLCSNTIGHNVLRPAVLVTLSNHQLLANLSFPIMSVMSITTTVLANSSKHLMLPNLSLPVIQVILSFVIPLVSLFLILLVIVS